MADGATPDSEVALETDRLVLGPWRVSEAALQRELWIERDPRGPPHRRIHADGRRTVADLEEPIRTNQPSSSIGLLTVERKTAGDVIGYCGLVGSGRGSDGEPVFALLADVQDAEPIARSCGGSDDQAAHRSNKTTGTRWYE